MIIPIEPVKDEEEKAAPGSDRPRTEKGFAIVGGDPGSPRACFERRAEEIARAAEIHVRKMVEQEAELVATPAPSELGPWVADAVERDAVPFGLKRRIVLRVPVFRRETPERPTDGAEEILLPEDLGRVSEETPDASCPGRADAELRRVRSLMAQVALDLIAQVIEINRYFAAAGFVKSPEVVSPGGADRQEREASSGKTMSGGSAGSSLRRRA